MPSRITNLEAWQNLHWADLSGQLSALHIVNDSYFDGGSLLKKDTENGAWLWGWLVHSPIPSSIPSLLPLLWFPFSSSLFAPSLLPLFLPFDPFPPQILTHLLSSAIPTMNTAPRRAKL